jgi:UDP-3-O-acyl N-acetylglucosamine deacetylase
MHRARILIVDDQEEILNSLGGILSDEGYDVILARDGQEALHIVQGDSPDVVFLDIWIPGIDGLQTLKAIKRIDRDCSVIMMSGHGTIETAVKAIKLGATDYLEKPLNLEDVLHLVERSSALRRSSEKGDVVNGLAAPGLAGTSADTERLSRELEEASNAGDPVWLCGAEGTGKEYAARVLHHLEGKERSSLIKVPCSDLTEANLNEVLNGKANAARRGRIAEAAGGTLLLVRVDRLQASLGPRLAELVKGIASTGSTSGSTGGRRARVVCTSVHEPADLVTEHGFPEELSGILGRRVIRIASLRERAADIPILVDQFLREASEEFDRGIEGIDGEAMKRLLEYPWPGNVKELKILVEHVVMTAPGDRITVGDLLIPGLGDQDRGVRVVRAGGSDAGTAVESNRRDSGLGADGGDSAAGGTSPQSDGEFRHQKSLRGRVVMYGQGLHSGVKTGLTLSPLPPGSGILFGHITSGGAVPAILGNVQSTEFSTCLTANGTSARTIEHLMAVFHMYGLTNVLVKISGEVPIMDGSAVEFCNLVENAEIIRQDELIERVKITEPLELPFPEDENKSLRVEPASHFEVEYFLDYPPPVGSMHIAYKCLDPEDFKENIAPARTFGFVRDMRMLDEMGLAGGGRLSNVILMDDEKVINPPLRFPDEFVRHKVLDVIGDFYLLGRPFQGKVIARGTGHTENIAMLRLINEKMKIIEGN